MKRDSIIKSILNLWPYILALCVFLIVQFLARNQKLTEKYYSERLYPFFADTFSQLSGMVPFSIWDIFWVIVLILAICGLMMVFLKKIRFKWYILTITKSLALFYSLFYLAWGFNYFRPPVEERLGWAESEINDTIFWSFLDTVICNTNASYVEFTGSDYELIDSLVEESFSKNQSSLGIDYPNGVRRPKRMVFSSFVAKLGVSGYFGPFFNEVHVNRYVLPMDYPYVLAHEKAHQFGIAGEAEANLLAYIVCSSSDDQRLNYSANLNILLYYLSDASKRKLSRAYLMKIERPVLLNLRYRRSYYLAVQNKTLEKMQDATNDAYLKTNHIDDGIKDYNRVVSLVISWFMNSEVAKR